MINEQEEKNDFCNDYNQIKHLAVETPINLHNY